MQVSFYQIIQAMSEATGKELSVESITGALRSTYHVGGPAYEGRMALRSFNLTNAPGTPGGTPADGESGDRPRYMKAKVSVDGIIRTIEGQGNGPLSSFLDALNRAFGIELSEEDPTSELLPTSSSSRLRPMRGTRLKEDSGVSGWTRISLVRVSEPSFLLQITPCRARNSRDWIS
jgi:2-isopropylmalate synthase